MKKSVIIFIISILVLVTAIVWLLNTKSPFSLEGIILTAGIVIIVGFSIFRGVIAAKAAINQEPAEDELSKNVMTKASSLSFYISIYSWLLIMYLSDKLNWESHTLIGAGIMAMALIFLCCWLFVKNKGFKNE